MVLQPGTQLRLPRGPLTSASRSDMTAVLQRASAIDESGLSLLYFDDYVFNMDNPVDMEAFHVELASATANSNRKSLVLYVDSSFTFEIVNSLINLAREAGVIEVNLASRPQGTTSAKDR
jgi:biopolymer transport protein ExbD